MGPKRKAAPGNADLLTIANPADFTHKWPSNLQDLPFTDHHWKEVCRLFFSPPGEKQSNIWHNEIREIALFNLFGLSPGTMSNDNPELYALYIEWIGALNQCFTNYIDAHSLAGPVDIIHLEKKGGQKTSHDFELKIMDAKGATYDIKIEFKFSASRTSSIAGLAQFAAINTESASAPIFFGKPGYVDFFYDQGYLERMCSSVKFNYDILRNIKNEWKKTAKAVTPPKTPAALKQFHEHMSHESVAKNESKKTIVNESFAAFIDDRMEYLRSNFEPISAVFNAKQADKYFCIFSKGTFKVETMPNIVIDNVTHERGQHFFMLHANGGFSIKCDMSWGNGGAGNRNPRVLFKLVEKTSSSKSATRKRKYSPSRSAGGNSGVVAVEEDEFPMEEELAEGDSVGKDIQDEIKRRGVMKPNPGLIELFRSTSPKSRSKRGRTVKRIK